MRIEPFTPEHVDGVRGAPPELFGDLFDADFVRAIASQHTWSVLKGDGNAERTVFVGGVLPRETGVVGWGVFTEHARPYHVLAVHRAVKAVLDDVDKSCDSLIRSIAIDLDPDFPQGLRWARMLGFEVHP